MAKRVIAIVLLLVLALFAYVGYRSYDAKRVGTHGEVYSNGSVRRAPEPREPPSESDTIVYPTAASTGAAAQDQNTPQPALAQGSPVSGTVAGVQQMTQNQQPAAGVPAIDSISPNPPNGMAFAGTGRYQLYRQGNLTWRLDTDSGRACVIFATDEEWRKPKVYSAGCGKN
jgi:hypothetical protein